MDTYIYQADIYCEECGRKIRERITAEGHAPADPKDERSYDSGDFPKGPESDGGGESDSPEHCHECFCPLGNNLTTDGEKYVLEHLAESLRNGTTTKVEQEWAALLADYQLKGKQKKLLDAYNQRFPAPDLSKAQIWVRVGDGSDYSEFGDDLDAAIDHIKEHSPGRPSRDYTRGGIQTENYGGNNYVSIYWGDSKANLIAELSSDEWGRVYRELDV